MRHTSPVQMYHVKHPRLGQSSPVYSVAFDQANLYVALDQCLTLVSFNQQPQVHHHHQHHHNHHHKKYYSHYNSNNKVVYYR